MSSKLVAAAAAFLLAVGAFLALRREPAEPEPSLHPAASRAPSTVSGLEGRATEPGPPPSSPAMPAPPAPAPVEPVATGAVRSLESLIAEIREEVDPSYWERTTESMLDGRNGIV